MMENNNIEYWHPRLFIGKKLTMEKYVWLFPILFIFYDMEEIIGFGI